MQNAPACRWPSCDSGERQKIDWLGKHVTIVFQMSARVWQTVNYSIFPSGYSWDVFIQTAGGNLILIFICKPFCFVFPPPKCHCCCHVIFVNYKNAGSCFFRLSFCRLYVSNIRSKENPLLFAILIFRFAPLTNCCKRFRVKVVYSLRAVFHSCEYLRSNGLIFLSQ